MRFFKWRVLPGLVLRCVDYFIASVFTLAAQTVGNQAHFCSELAAFKSYSVSSFMKHTCIDSFAGSYHSGRSFTVEPFLPTKKCAFFW